MKRDVVKKFLLNIQRSTATVQQSTSALGDEEETEEKKALLGY